ncbi:GNAT family N-acetyltransferase [Novosphingobium aquiterrae]|uniref:GNAT family N-acetyltransferase n=1 Tax=Novosphingobium aquiterrae TaxID=624388 RepID=A0ABV6PDJ7_9SPHN
MASLAAKFTPEADRPATPAPAAASARALDWRALEAAGLRPQWDALAAAATEPNPFHEAWYLLPALRALDPQGSVKLLAVELDGALIGLLPLRHEARYYGRLIPQMCNWIHGNCFLGAPLVASEHRHAFWRALLDWADQQGGQSLFLHLAQIPLDGPLHGALQDVLAEQGRHAALVHREERALLSSDLSPEAYFEASLSGKKRKELRRQTARLAELGTLNFERRTDAAHLDAWIEQFLALEHSGWKGTAGSALASHHTTADLFRAALTGAAAQGRLERLTLTLGDEPIAMLVQFLAPPGAFSYKTAFDERFARFSPGVLLQRENLAILGHPGVAWCDSCASADHPMIDHIWRERRAIGRLSIAIGGPLRRALFRQIARLETRRSQRP